MNVYIVMAISGTGEWDHSEWPVAYYNNEEQALLHVKMANNHKVTPPDFDNPYDKECASGVDYFCRIVEMLDSLEDWKRLNT